MQKHLRNSIDRLVRIDTILVVRQREQALNDEIIVPVQHTFRRGVSNLDTMPFLPSDLRAMYKTFDGGTFFEFTDSSIPDYALQIFRAGSLQQSRQELQEGFQRNRRVSPEAWAGLTNKEVETAITWSRGLFPFATYGSGYDVIAIDSLVSPNSKGRVRIIYSDFFFAGGPPDPDEDFDSWENLDTFFEWFVTSLPTSLPSTFIYTDSNGNQYSPILSG